MAARDIDSDSDSDFDFAFQLQLEEAISASLSLQPSTSTSNPTPIQLHPNRSDVQSSKLLNFEQEFDDRMLSELDFRRMHDDLHRRIHDNQVAQEILRMPEDVWQDCGDNFERPFGEGTSRSVDNEDFRVYFKGLVDKHPPNVFYCGIGVAICDSRDQLLFEMRKPLYGSEKSRQCIEFEALIEALNAAIALDLKRLVFFCDYRPIFQYVTGRWPTKQRKVAALLNQVVLLQQKFSSCQPSLVPRNEIKFAFQFAREAIISQMKKVEESAASKEDETCAICLEVTDVHRIFSVDGCKHRYCVSCMKQHVEVKLLHGMVPKCPHAECNSDLKLDSCCKFLTPKLIDIMKQRIKEASIPVTEKVYCPYPKCSALMSKSEVLEYSKGVFAVGAERFGKRKCTNCNGLFCIDCKVPWHNGVTCNEYGRSNPKPPEDVKLKTLAERYFWRQCVKCNHMIELAAGCYHITCRCGYEFCYTCGAPWKDKKATCVCKLWDEDNILGSDEDGFDGFDEFDEFDDEEEDYDYYDSDDDFY